MTTIPYSEVLDTRISKRIEFIVPGEVRGQGRPRATIRGNHASVYESSQDRASKHNIQLYAAEAMRAEGYALAKPDGMGITVKAEVFVRVPSSMSKKKRVDALAGWIKPQRKPDLDNVLKALLDAMNGVVYGDDVQVAKVVASRHYAEAWGLKVTVIWCEEEGSK